MPVITPLTKITSIREHGLEALNEMSDFHGVSNVELVTCIVLYVTLLLRSEQKNIITEGHKIDLLIRLDCRLDDYGNLDYSHIPQFRQTPTKE